MQQTVEQVWLCIPTVSPEKAKRNLPKWKKQGYKVAVLQDRVRFDLGFDAVDTIARPWDTYKGYAKSCNYLVGHCVGGNVPLFVFAGDDMLPDPKMSALEALAVYRKHFPDFGGVMQPTGDRWPNDAQGCGVDRICGSPFVGREFINGAFNGNGPWCEEYHHFYADEEMHEVAARAGLLLHNGDMSHFHEHWMRDPSNKGKRPAMYDPIQEHWDSDKAVFNARKAQGFPGYNLPNRI